MQKKINSDKDYFRQLRLNYISHMIAEYSTNKSGDVEERILNLLHSQKRQCINTVCGQTYETLKRKCGSCGSVVRNVDKVPVLVGPQTSSNNEKYIFLGEQNKTNLKQMQMGEPIVLNPNSYDNLEKILEELKVNTAIGVDREWTFVGADGPPYCLASRLIGKDEKKYDWVSMVPGLGKITMD